jgi:hypothetical protein
MTRRRTIPAGRAAAFAAALAIALGAATVARAESVFGLYLLGERVDAGDARASALGGFVQILDDSLGVLQYNPAAVAWSKRVAFGVAGYFTSDLNQAVGYEERVNATKLSNLTVAFPVYKKLLTGSIGFRGRYDPDGSFQIARETSEGDPYRDFYERSGGLFTVPFTLAFDAGKYAKVGAFYSIERGTLDTRWVIDFEGSNADAVSTQEQRLTGHGIGAGFVARPIPKLSLGLTWEAAIDYDVEVTETHTSSSADTAYESGAELPSRMTLSATWRIATGFVVYAGGSVCDFRDFEGLAFPKERLAREEIAAIGLEYRFSGPRIPVRASFRYEQLPYTLPDGEEITRMAFTVGTGLIMRGGRGKVDTGLQFATTGSVDTNQYADRSVRVYLSITGSEDWKRARDRRYQGSN